MAKIKNTCLLERRSALQPGSGTAAPVMIEETQNSNETGDGVTQMCCCSQKPACIESEHARTCTAARYALDPCIDSSAAQSSQLSTNPSIAA